MSKATRRWWWRLVRAKKKKPQTHREKRYLPRDDY